MGTRQVALGAVLICLMLARIPAAGADAPFVLRLCHAAREGSFASVEGAFTNVFKAVVETKTGGKIRVEVHPCGEFGGQRDLAARAVLGNIEAAFISDRVLADFCPQAMIFSLPYLFAKIDDPRRLFRSPWGAAFAGECARATGLRVIQVGGCEFRHISNSRRPITRPPEAAGLRLRVAEKRVAAAMIKGLGEVPHTQPVDWLYRALRDGGVDGQEGSTLDLSGDRLFEAQRYLTLTQHQLMTAVALMNDTFYRTLPTPLQAIVDEA
ncbi:MAG: TRAP transporter substrate-binding protein, partial [Acidobacteria bacterium]